MVERKKRVTNYEDGPSQTDLIAGTLLSGLLQKYAAGRAISFPGVLTDYPNSEALDGALRRLENLGVIDYDLSTHNYNVVRSAIGELAEHRDSQGIDVVISTETGLTKFDRRHSSGRDAALIVDLSNSGKCDPLERDDVLALISSAKVRSLTLGANDLSFLPDSADYIS